MMKVAEVLGFARHKINEVKRSLQRVERQRQLLNQREEELKQTLARWESIAQELSHESAEASIDTIPDLSGMRLSDACYHILKAKEHGLHAKELVLELQKLGRVMNAKNPVDSVHKMLLRDRRFYRPGDQGTYWELEERQIAHLEETQKTT
ncbi:MAG: hypothetical protein NT134_00970 [Chloroflexi bacterium]|nr:hypothetical protein [Chloroflexota bacterium]